MDRLKIAIDVGCTRGKKAGIAWYAINLLANLEKIDHEDTYLLYTFYSRSRKFTLDREVLPTGYNFKLKECWIPYRIARFLLERAKLPIDSIIGSFDVFHALNYSVPLLTSGKLVLTVHDLAFLIYPDRNFTSAEFTKYGISRVRNLAQRADMIIAVSQNTKHDIEDVLGIAGEKIRVVYEAADKFFVPLNKGSVLTEVRRKYGLPEKFILHVGTMEPRKNIPLLLRSYHNLKEKQRVEHKLVLVGKLGWAYESIFDLLEELRLETDVIVLGHILRADLPALYNLADLFVYPSFYEGFGLPPLEAMACGTPVIASCSSCFPEILGEAAILIDPNDVSGLSEKMYIMITDSVLRARYIERGLERAGLFSWERVARETLQIYKEVSQLEK
jgi:glycosyltransferase involved in cell wall biosynthesis